MIGKPPVQATSPVAYIYATMSTTNKSNKVVKKILQEIFLPLTNAFHVTGGAFVKMESNGKYSFIVVCLDQICPIKIPRFYDKTIVKDFLDYFCTLLSEKQLIEHQYIFFIDSTHYNHIRGKNPLLPYLHKYSYSTWRIVEPYKYQII